jgi:N6-adenosine-specific RNA methylase IME4
MQCDKGAKSDFMAVGDYFVRSRPKAKTEHFCIPFEVMKKHLKRVLT